MSELKVEQQKSLATFTSWLVGGPAEHYCAPESLGQLQQAMVLAHKNKWPISLLGGGTNALVSDQGVPGLVIHTHKLNRVEVSQTPESVLIEAECGTPKTEILKHFLKLRLAPATFFAGLPGDVAGGVVMNAGVGHKVSPKEFCEVVHSFDVFSVTKSKEADVATGTGTASDSGPGVVCHTYAKGDVQWSYRKSEGWQPGVIAKVRLTWPNQPDDGVLKAVREGNKRRKETQPLSEPSCGSVFKNPDGDHAGRLIEACGLKGYRVGGAQVSEKHANFVVNKGQATASEIDAVIQHVQETVLEQMQVHLTNEVVYLGTWPS